MKSDGNDLAAVVKEIWVGVREERNALIIGFFLSAGFVGALYFVASLLIGDQ